MVAHRKSDLTSRPMNLWLNSVGGFLLYFLVFFVVRRASSGFLPLTIDTLWQVILTDISRQKSARILRLLREQIGDRYADHTKEPLTNGNSTLLQHRRHKVNNAGVPYLVSIVGYREEESLFKKVLESYQYSCTGLSTMLVAIDGNAAPDLDMVAIVRRVYQNAKVIPLAEPFSKMAQRLAELEAFGPLYCPPASDHDRLDAFNSLPKKAREGAEAVAMSQVVQAATQILEANGAFDDDCGVKGELFQVLCFYEPHEGKKDVIFTNAIFSLVMKGMLGIEYVWTSDSDTLVLENTVDQAIGCTALDAGVGGTCTSLGVHNGDDSLVATLAAAAYWSELAFCRGQSGAVDATDCQPGPCAAFRIEALSEVLFKWYMQTSLGRKTVVNDDRHLTTCLLMKSWRVTFNTYILTLTDTPKTAIALLLQQLRWSRATYIETIQYPVVYAIHGPISLLCAVRRIYGPLAMAVLSIRYAISGGTPFAISLTDICLRVTLSAAYNLIFLPQHEYAVRHWSFLISSQFFYQLPLPGIALWSLITMLQGTWGTNMRSQQQKATERHLGRENWGTVLAMSAWMGIVAGAGGRYIGAMLLPGNQGSCAAFAWAAVSVSVAWLFLK